MTPLDVARSCIGLQAKNNGSINANPAARSLIGRVFINQCTETYNPRNARRFDSLLFTAAEEVALLQEQGLAKGTPPQPGDICMISIEGRYHWCIIEHVAGNRIYTIEFNTDEVRETYEVWQKPGGWPMEKVSYLLRPKV